MKPRTAAILALAVALFLVVWYQLLLILPIQRALGVAGTAGAPFLEENWEAIKHGFLEGLPRTVNPLSALRWEFRISLLVMSGAGFLLWLGVSPSDLANRLKSPYLVAFAALSPLVVGLWWYPLSLRYSFRVLAENGITAPSSIGIALSESLTCAFLGLFLSVISVALAILFRSRFRSIPSQDGAFEKTSRVQL